MSRLRVVVLFGGRSVEREVSRISARAIVDGLDPARYEVVPLGVSEDGRFLSAAESAQRLASGSVPEKFRVTEGPDRAERPGPLVPSEIGPGRADVIIPMIHGTTGEDGALQGFLETLGIAYVGAGVAASAIGMDKGIFKALLRDAGLPTPRSVLVRGPQPSLRPEPLPFSFPVFVKPANGGSSVGVSKVKRPEDLDAAIALSLRYDEAALIEEGIDARELECAVLGDEEPRASIVGEVVPGHEFYDYDDKYREDKARLLVPAPIPEETAAEVRRLAVEVFRRCGISGMARVDFFLERGTDRVLVNELNTLPGFTTISMYPKLWEATGLPLSRLLDELIRLALARKERRDRLSHKPPAELT